MSNSPLNHKKRGGIAGFASGLFGGRKRKRNSNQNDPNSLNNLQNFSQQGGIHGAIGKLALQQQGGNDAIDNATAMQQEALSSVENTEVNPIDIQKEQVAQASGLSALTQGPAGAETGTLADRDYNTLMGGLNKGSAFAMKSPLKSTYTQPKTVIKKHDNKIGKAIDEVVQGVGAGVVSALAKKGTPLKKEWSPTARTYTKPETDGETIISQPQPTSIADSFPARDDASGSDVHPASNLESTSAQTYDDWTVPKTTRLENRIEKVGDANPAQKARLEGKLERTKMRQSARAERIADRNVNKKQRVEDYQKMRNDKNYSAIDFIKDRFKKKNKNQNTSSSSNSFFGGMDRF